MNTEMKLQKSGWTFYGSNTLRAAAFSSER